MRRLIIIVFLHFLAQLLYCQLYMENETLRGDVRIMFYNAENYFDIYNDSLVNDNEFLPNGDKRWTYYRFREKTTNIYKVIVAVGGTKPPEIVCFAEIENRFVLNELIHKTPLEKYSYKIIHFDSPDRRGIDVGIIYRTDVVKLLKSEAIPVTFSDDPRKTSRDILYAKVLINSRDTLYLFVNHWPSRMGGLKKSETYRVQTAGILRKTIDTILSADSCAKIIITGDFNDEPFNKSITNTLQALKPEEYFECRSVYNLSAYLLEQCKCGTYRYGSSWNMFDQFMVSGSLLFDRKGLKTCTTCKYIADFNFLLVDDEKYGGKKPFRSYIGPVYKGGFSDHLPVYLDLYY